MRNLLLTLSVLTMLIGQVSWSGISDVNDSNGESPKILPSANHPPMLNNSLTVPAGFACSGMNDTIFTDLVLSDADLDLIRVLNIESSDHAVLYPGNTAVTALSSTGADNHYRVTANPGAGTAYYILTVTDGVDTVIINLPAVTISAPIMAKPAQPGPFCVGSSPADLPETNPNGFSGYWYPSPTVNTASAGTFTYTFSPYSNQCAYGTTVDIEIKYPQTVSFGPIGPFCQNDPMATLPPVSTDGTSGTWSPAFNTATPGTTTYTFSPTSGCASPTTVMITVNPGPTLNVSPAVTICKGTSTTLTASGATNYAWSPATGLSSTTTSSVVATPTATKTYTVTGQSGACTSSATVTVTVTPIPVPIASNTGPGCQGQSITLSQSFATINSASWTGPNGFTSTLKSPVLTNATPAMSGTYTLVVVRNGCPSNPVTTNVLVTPYPVINVTPSTTVCYGNSTSLSASGADSFSWTGGGLSTTSGPDVVASPESTTTFTVTGTTNGCSSTGTVTVTVNQSPDLTVDNTSANICAGSSVVLTATGANNYSWSPSESLSSSTTAAVTATPTVTTKYTVTGESNGCTTSVDATVFVYAAPVLDIPDATLCQGGSVTLSPSIMSQTAIYSWSPATGLSSTSGPSVTASPTVTTTYTVTATDMESGCISTKDIVVTVINGITVNVTASNAVICKGSPVTLTASGATNYTWSATGSVASSGFSATTGDIITATPTISKTFKVVGETGGCLDSASVSITLTPLPVPVASNTGPVCEGQSITLSQSYSTINSASWTGPNGFTSTLRSPVITNATILASGTYTLVVVRNGCASNPVTTNVAVNPGPVLNVTPSVFICPGETATLTASGDAVSYVWSPSTGLNTTTGAVVNASPSVTTDYVVTATGSKGCTATATTKVSVTHGVPIITPSAASVCDDGSSSVLLTAKGAASYTWSPATGLSSTTGDSVTANPSATTTYKVVGVQGACKDSSLVTVTVKTPASFHLTSQFCQESTVPDLPTFYHGYTGTWDQSSVNTSSIGTSTYTFTPDPGQCAITSFLDITIAPMINPNFPVIGDQCQFSVPFVLPAASLEGVTGTWSPNTINTDDIGSTMYTFTPAPTECAYPTSIIIKVNGSVTPIFSTTQPICQNATPPTLPTASTNGINGTWSPATINTSTPGIYTFTFTPDPAGPCALPISQTVIIKQPTTPQIDAIPSLCQNATAPTLPGVTVNGITGTWSPSTINTATSGISTYTFTPGATQCATTATINVTMYAPVNPTFSSSSINLCSGQGIVNLNDFVTPAGGTFMIDQAISIPKGLFNTNSSPVTAGSAHNLSYTVTNGACVVSAPINLTINNSPSVSISTTTTACTQKTATATAAITGGSTPYSLLQWTSGEQGVTNVSNLGSGEYGFTVIDKNGCNATSFFTIAVSGSDLTGSVTNVNCFGQSNGAIVVTPVNLQAPLNVIWSSGHSQTSIAHLVAGNYTISVTDATGCAITKSFVVNQPDELITTVSTVIPDCQVSNGEMHVTQTSGGTTPYTYAWSNSDLGTSSVNQPGGFYSLTTTDAHSCMSVNQVSLNEKDAALLSGFVTPTECGGATGAIDVTPVLPVGVSVTSINWSNSATTEDIQALTASSFTCTLITSNGCRSVASWTIPVVAPEKNEICVVTVDSATTTNLVVWEKQQPVGVYYYNIYRETILHGDFALIAKLDASNPTIFNDVVASPLVRSWRYRISAVNGCNVEGPLSTPHQTIHLDVIDNAGSGVTVNWNAYEGTAFDDYVISRYTDADGWVELATLPNTQLTYTDNTSFSTQGLDYMVQMDLSSQCTAQRWRAQDFNSSRSNKDKGRFVVGSGTDDQSNGLDENYLSGVKVFPNPTTDVLTIEQTAAQPLAIEIRSIDGQVIQQVQSSELTNTLHLGELATGIYFVNIRINNAEQMIRIVKQ